MMLLIKLLVFLNYQFGLEKSEKAFRLRCHPAEHATEK